ncbi:MAG: hypothetical protein ACON5F_13860 [Jejuia sp.]
MKNLVTLLALVCFTFASAQSKDEKQNVKLKDLNITVEVASEDDVKSTFKVSDFKELTTMLEANSEMSFKIVCNGKSEKGLTHLIYKVKGNTNDIDSFLKDIRTIRKSAIKYYKNKA